MNQPLKRVGIWMDHSSAHIMEHSSVPVASIVITAKSHRNGHVNSEDTSENKKHNIEQHQQSDYYKELGETIKKFDEVLLFGPTEAKIELYNLLKADRHFEKIKIETKQSDKMTENQLHAFVSEYFA